MTNRWKITVEPTVRCVRILVTDPDGNELLKAALPSTPEHPRALLTLLEALALWAGEPLTAALFAGPQSPRRFDEALFGAGLMRFESALIRFDVTVPSRRRRTLAGVGDFRHLRLAHRRSS